MTSSVVLDRTHCCNARTASAHCRIKARRSLTRRCFPVSLCGPLHKHFSKGSLNKLIERPDLHNEGKVVRRFYPWLISEGQPRSLFSSVAALRWTTAPFRSRANTTSLCRFPGSKEKSRPHLPMRGKRWHPDFRRSMKGTFTATVDRANQRFLHQ